MRLLIGLGAGTGLVLILRWYWWRINAWSEISAMLASVVFSQVASFVFTEKGPESDAKQLLFIVACSAVVWVPWSVIVSARPRGPRAPARAG